MVKDAKASRVGRLVSCELIEGHSNVFFLVPESFGDEPDHGFLGSRSSSQSAWKADASQDSTSNQSHAGNTKPPIVPIWLG